MAGNDTAALVVALSAQLTKFEKDMQKAVGMADQATSDIEDKFSKMNPSISTSFFGNLFAGLADKVISGVADAIKEVVNRFQELQKVSDYTGESMQWIYGLQEAFKKAGGSVEDVNAALKSVAFQLDEMQRGGDNALSKLFAAPGNQQFLKGFNAEAATAEETMKRVLMIIGEQANMIRAVDVGKNLGVPASVAAAAWKEGGDALSQAAASAAAAAPDLQKMANAAALFDTYMKSALDALKAWISDNAWAAVKDTISEIVKILQLFQTGGVFTHGPLENFGADALKNLDALQTKMNQFGPPTPTAARRVTITGGTAEDPFARQASAATGRDYLAQQNDQIEKHIALMNADAEAVGQGVAKREELRTSALLMTAAEKDHVAVTDELRLAIQAQAEAAGQAAQKLAEAQFNLQRINSASQQLGSAISTAFADAIVEGKKLNEVVSSLLKTLAKAAINSTIMSLFSPGAGGGLSPFAGLFKAGGGPVEAGGAYIVGERGPELFRPQTAGMVIPNDVLRQGGSQGGAIVYSPSIDARGASVEAVARLAQIMEQDRASFASRTVATIQQARRSRVSGL